MQIAKNLSKYKYYFLGALIYLIISTLKAFLAK